MGAATEGMEVMSEAEKAGTAIGAGIGMAMIFGIWVFGDIILGLFVLITRPKSWSAKKTLDQACKSGAISI